jgi:hypothetical protein
MRDLYYTSARASIALKRIRKNLVERLPPLLASTARPNPDGVRHVRDDVADAARRPAVVRARGALLAGRPERRELRVRALGMD